MSNVRAHQNPARPIIQRRLAGEIMDRFIFWAFVIGVLLLGLWGAERGANERANNPPQYSTPFMKCYSIADYRQARDCAKREGIADDPADPADDPKNEPRRR
jgi:hypothetical protein